MRAHKTYALFVDGGDGPGIVTRTDLLEATLLDRTAARQPGRPARAPSGPLASPRTT